MTSTFPSPHHQSIRTQQQALKTIDLTNLISTQVNFTALTNTIELLINTLFKHEESLLEVKSSLSELTLVNIKNERNTREEKCWITRGELEQILNSYQQEIHNLKTENKTLSQQVLELNYKILSLNTSSQQGEKQLLDKILSLSNAMATEMNDMKNEIWGQLNSSIDVKLNNCKQECVEQLKTYEEKTSLRCDAKIKTTQAEIMDKMKEEHLSFLSRVISTEHHSQRIEKALNDSMNNVLQRVELSNNRVDVLNSARESENKTCLNLVNILYNTLQLNMDELKTMGAIPGPKATEIMLQTPTLVELRSIINHDLNDLKQYIIELQSNMNLELARNVKELKDAISKRLVKDDLHVAISDCTPLKELENLSKKHDQDLNRILEQYLTRDQIWEALRLKADDKNLELKADRKFVSSMFDYLNEKISVLLGEENSSDKLMQAIHALEDELHKKANLSDLIEMEMQQQQMKPATYIPNTGLDTPLLMKNDLGSNPLQRSEHSQSLYKCLSCNRPTTPPSSRKLHQPEPQHNRNAKNVPPDNPLELVTNHDDISQEDNRTKFHLNLSKMREGNLELLTSSRSSSRMSQKRPSSAASRRTEPQDSQLYSTVSRQSRYEQK